MAKPSEDDHQLEPVLLVRAQALQVALRLDDVGETCRPLPVQPVGGLPEFVRGLAVIRGITTPVIHLGRLLAGATEPGTRFVTVRVLGRPVALEVDEVIGVRRLSRSRLESHSLLVGGALAPRADALGVLDGALLAWISASRLVDEETLAAALSGRERA